MIFFSGILVLFLIYYLTVLFIDPAYQSIYVFLITIITAIVFYFIFNMIQLATIKGKKANITSKKFGSFVLVLLIEGAILTLIYLLYSLLFSIFSGVINWVFQLLGFLVILFFNIFNRLVVNNLSKTK